MTDTSKTAKIIKKVILFNSTLTGNVMVSDINFLCLLLFSMCQSLHVVVNKCIN